MQKQTKNKSDTGPWWKCHEKLSETGEIWTIQDNEKKVYKWDIYSTNVYSFLYNRIYGMQGNTCLALDHIAGKVNASVSVVKDRLYNMEKAGILKVCRRKGWGGYKVNWYQELFDLNDPKQTTYKLRKNKHMLAYLERIKDRKQREKELQGIVIDNSWTPQQIRFYVSNCNYELRTGEFLKGDKLSGLLYLKDLRKVTGKDGKETYKPIHHDNENFSIRDELKEYEFKRILENAHFIDSEEEQ